VRLGTLLCISWPTSGLPTMMTTVEQVWPRWGCLDACCSCALELVMVNVSVQFRLYCIFDYFKSSGQSQTWPELGTHSSRSQIWIWRELDFRSQNNTPEETNGVSCYKEAMQFKLMLSAAIKRQCSLVLPLLCHCLPVLDKVCRSAMNFVFFFIWVTPIKIVNTPLDRPAALFYLKLTEHISAALPSGKCR